MEAILIVLVTALTGLLRYTFCFQEYLKIRENQQKMGKN